MDKMRKLAQQQFIGEFYWYQDQKVEEQGSQAQYLALVTLYLRVFWVSCLRGYL